MYSSNILKNIFATCSPSGHEESFRALLKEMVSPFVNDIIEDIHGNLICYKRGADPICDKTIMFVAHMDEVGLMVSYIEDSGFIRFTRIGGVDLLLLTGRIVKIIHSGAAVPGIIGAKPYHMKSHCNEREPDESEFWIDIGISGRKEVEKLVSIGDCIVIDSPYTELSTDLIASRGCDDKAGVISLIKMLELIKDADIKSNIAVVFSVQEEVGLRGAKTSSYFVSPDICIAVDVAHATDYPSINKAKYGDIYIGGGPVISLGSDLTTSVQNELKDIAHHKGISFQRHALPGASGTDINAIQVNKSGCATGLISIPCRYMHSPTEVISLSDVDSVSEILAAFCKSK
ncbi:MAG: M20/M25/M40 family metallo-hydrolase [Bacteroidales bacterium]|nr:M20/M25/M40 family metallo-hydrolase [Bacteroidales bacterium]